MFEDDEYWDWASYELLAPRESRGAVFAIRFSHDELAQLQARADFRGKLITQYIRDLVISDLSIPAWRQEQCTSSTT